MCVCEMRSSCVKGSAAPSRMKTPSLQGGLQQGCQDRRRRLRRGHWCVSSSDGRQKSSVRMATHAGPCLPSVCTPARCFSFFCPLEITEWLVSDPFALWDEGGNDSVNMRIFSLLWITHPEITLFTPHFSLIIHWFTTKWCSYRLIRVALAELFTNLWFEIVQRVKEDHHVTIFAFCYTGKKISLTMKSTFCFVGVQMSVFFVCVC